MKSVSHHVKKKFKTIQDIVHSQDCVVVIAFFCLEKLYNKTIVDYCRLRLGQYWYSQVDIISCPMPQ